MRPLAPEQGRMTATVIYDGDCPFCARYTALLALRSVTDVVLINARERPDLVQTYLAQGLDLNDGMIAILDGRTLHGAEAMRAISLLAGQASLFTLINRLAFSSPAVGRRLYPLLRLGRHLTLRALGRAPIATTPKPAPDAI
jgi:predicted DCC family thiol-disulfide oxidoreductase YuxK